MTTAKFVTCKKEEVLLLVQKKTIKEFRDDPLNDLSLWKLAWHSGALVGFVISQIDNRKGTIKEVSVKQEFRRRGLARALFLLSLQELKKRGVINIRTHTDAEGKSGARQLYESVGFKPKGIQYAYRKELTIQPKL